LKEQYLEKKKAWEELDCSTYSKWTETQQLTGIQQWKEWLAKFPDGNYYYYY